MNNLDESEYEVDATVMFRQEAQNLHQSRGLEDTLSKFGYSADDRIPRRELVMIYNAAKKAMEEEIIHLAHSNRYDDAKQLRGCLTKLRSEFDGMQTGAVAKTRQDQTKFFDQARREISIEVSGKHEREKCEVDNYIEERVSALQRHHMIQTEKLEKEVSKMHCPHTKYSKRLIELMKSEHSLIRLKQYDEARKVRNMIEKILPKEEKNFHDNYEKFIENKRSKLRSEQREDSLRLEEAMKAVEWKDIRRRQLEQNILDQRFKNHTKDMTHQHLLESKLRPEMSVKPSALWQKRSGYSTTSAALRGEQLLGYARGKKQGEQVLNDKLVERHDFSEIPMDTITLE